MPLMACSEMGVLRTRSGHFAPEALRCLERAVGRLDVLTDDDEVLVVGEAGFKALADSGDALFLLERAAGPAIVAGSVDVAGRRVVHVAPRRGVGSLHGLLDLGFDLFDERLPKAGRSRAA